MGLLRRIRNHIYDSDMRLRAEYALRASMVDAHEREVQVLQHRNTVTLEALRYMIELTCPECSEAGRANVLVQCMDVAERRVLQRLQSQPR